MKMYKDVDYPDWPTKLAIEVDEEVLKVLTFIQLNCRCSRMVAIAEQVNQLAPILWGRHQNEEILPPAIGDEARDFRLRLDFLHSSD